MVSRVQMCRIARLSFMGIGIGDLSDMVFA
jgi:hypothetical protein